jgi:hypothetical protein
MKEQERERRREREREERTPTTLFGSADIIPPFLLCRRRDGHEPRAGSLDYQDN